MVNQVTVGNFLQVCKELTITTMDFNMEENTIDFNMDYMKDMNIQHLLDIINRIILH